jgi:hypothetical protein
VIQDIIAAEARKKAIITIKAPISPIFVTAIAKTIQNKMQLRNNAVASICPPPF